jgi:GNAT superfamily N-acetyltransferase
MINHVIRLATFDDVPGIEALMKRSIKGLGLEHYSDQQIDACCQFICVPDSQLIEDKTYFVAVNPEGNIVGCGGWSFRNLLSAGHEATAQSGKKLDPATERARIRAMFVDPAYSGQGIGSKILKQSEQAARDHGFSKGTLAAMLSGFVFYKAKGWKPIKEETLALPNGVGIGVVIMEKDL